MNHSLVQQAGEWLARLEGQGRPANWEHPEFRQWMAQSADHRLAFAEASALWFGASELDPVPTVEAPAASRSRMARLGQGAALTLVLLAAALLPDWHWLWLRSQADLSAQRGVLVQSTLADGSTVTLAGHSAVRQLEQGRGVELLSGSVVLDVTHDADRPFRVRAGDTEIRVLGTRFGVFNRDDQIRVGVLEGRVRVVAGTESIELSAGQQVRLDGAALEPDRISPDEWFSWSEGRLLVRERGLDEVIRRLQPFSEKRIWLRAAPPGQPLSAVLNLADSDRALATLAQQAGLQLTVAGPLYILH